jgi:hypothetical protein
MGPQPHPKQWVAIASWRKEDVLACLRETPEFEDASVRIETYPAGSSSVHIPSGELEVVFL